MLNRNENLKCCVRHLWTSFHATFWGQGGGKLASTVIKVIYILLKNKEAALIDSCFHFEVLNWFHNENIVKDWDHHCFTCIQFKCCWFIADQIAFACAYTMCVHVCVCVYSSNQHRLIDLRNNNNLLLLNTNFLLRKCRVCFVFRGS